MATIIGSNYRDRMFFTRKLF